ncbi:MAG TPA: Arc family DNA-binding protein [Tepidisphaeraceae bacterium]|jgi:plasmid stability protein|nr:Arc family DNA-binding protein [Tepidisphaeraceae bacterium]
MAQLVIDDLEDDVRDKLADLARDHGRSVSEEVRGILREAVTIQPDTDPSVGLGTRLARRFAGLGLDHEIPELRGGRIEAPSFEP